MQTGTGDPSEHVLFSRSVIVGTNGFYTISLSTANVIQCFKEKEQKAKQCSKKMNSQEQNKMRKRRRNERLEKRFYFLEISFLLHFVSPEWNVYNVLAHVLYI